MVDGGRSNGAEVLAGLMEGFGEGLTPESAVYKFGSKITEGDLAAAKVTIFNNGPIRVEGDFQVVDQEGNAFGLAGRTAITLCRCGHSANQPFCDGSHKRNNFANTVTARDLPSQAPKP